MKLKQLDKENRQNEQTWLSNWEVRTKIVTCIAIAFLLVPVKNLLALGLYTLFLFTIISLARLELGKILKKLFLLFPFLLLLGVPVLLSGGFPPEAARVEIVLLLMLKAISTVFLLFIIVFTHPIQLILNGIAHMNLPDKMVSILFLSWRYVFLLREKLSQTYKALLSRLFQGGLGIRSYKIYGEIIGGLFVKSIDSSERVYKAMLSRGYSGKHIVAKAEKITSLDWLKSIAMLTSVIILYLI